jgi:hypothetical protein
VSKVLQFLGLVSFHLLLDVLATPVSSVLVHLSVLVSFCPLLPLNVITFAELDNHSIYSHIAPTRSYIAPTRSYIVPKLSYIAPTRSYNPPKRSCIAYTLLHCSKLLIHLHFALYPPQPRNIITFAELDGRCLPGDRDLQDMIILSEDFPAASCLAQDHVGIRLVLGDFVDEWKAVVSTNLCFLVFVEAYDEDEGRRY